MDANKLIAKGEELGNAYATAKSQADYLDHYRRVRIAMLMRDAEAEGHKSVAAQEREALGSPDYRDFLKTLRAAQEEAEKARWACKVLEWEVDLTRTAEASKRAELKVLQG